MVFWLNHIPRPQKNTYTHNLWKWFSSWVSFYHWCSKIKKNICGGGPIELTKSYFEVNLPNILWCFLFVRTSTWNLCQLIRMKKSLSNNHRFMEGWFILRLFWLENLNKVFEGYFDAKTFISTYSYMDVLPPF